MNLPRGKLIDTLKGGPDVLQRLLAGLSGRDFNGYIKFDHQREETEAHGIIILMGSRPVMAIYIWKNRVFGQPSLRPILRDTLDEECTLKVFLLPEEARSEMNSALEQFTMARIDIDAFDMDRETRLVLGDPGSKPHVGAGAIGKGSGARDAGSEPPAPGPQVPAEEAAALYSSISQIGVDTSDIKRKEEELLRKEMQMRQELEQGKKERDILKQEEEHFVKMDDAFQKLMKLREGEKAEKEGALVARITELQLQLDKRAEDIASREEEMRREIGKLGAEKEEMKRREEKLLEMEKMFRRVLTNTEERLKRKEEELARKEAELENVLRQRMREIEELKAQAASARGAGPARVELLKMEDDFKTREGALRKREGELEDRIRSFQLELAGLDDRKEALRETPARAAGAGANPALDEEELRTLLRNLDSLFDQLPEDAVSRFAGSGDFALYEKIMARLGLSKK